MKKILFIFLFLVFFLYCGWSDAYSTDEKPGKNASFGIGQGYLYGGLGVNFEYSPLDYFSFFGAIGMSRNSDATLMYFPPLAAGYSIGVRVYPLKKGQFYSPRVGLSYGYNGINRSVFKSVYITKNITTGIGISLGSDFKLFNNFSLDFDFLIPITKKGETYIEINGKTSNINLEKDTIFHKFSFGFRYNLFF